MRESNFLGLGVVDCFKETCFALILEMLLVKICYRLMMMVMLVVSYILANLNIIIFYQSHYYFFYKFISNFSNQQ
jgi:hypothetical protein